MSTLAQSGEIQCGSKSPNWNAPRDRSAGLQTGCPGGVPAASGADWAGQQHPPVTPV